jgi:hypothetical protein
MLSNEVGGHKDSEECKTASNDPRDGVKIHQDRVIVVSVVPFHNTTTTDGKVIARVMDQNTPSIHG